MECRLNGETRDSDKENAINSLNSGNRPEIANTGHKCTHTKKKLFSQEKTLEHSDNESITTNGNDDDNVLWFFSNANTNLQSHRIRDRKVEMDGDVE